MASGYQTSDGVDLDSRYLGINAKAKSAVKADTATNANHATSADSAVSLTTGLGIQTATSNYVTVANMDLPWTAPVDCYIDSIRYNNERKDNYMCINGKRIGMFKEGDGSREDLKIYIHKGDVLSGVYGVYLLTLVYIPYKIC